MMSPVLVRPLVYTTKIISTIVDPQSQRLWCIQVYTTKIISTIVDNLQPNDEVKVYTTKIISTIVDRA